MENRLRVGTKARDPSEGYCTFGEGMMAWAREVAMGGEKWMESRHSWTILLHK